MNILVTGGAGYIGSHAVLALYDAGHKVVVLDNLVYGHREIIEPLEGAELVVGGIADRLLVETLLKQYEIDAVMHFAAYAYVGESVSNPSKYYNNNVAGSIALFDAMVACGVKRIIFSSTCATYGEPNQVPITEDEPQTPINPYGASKLMIEHVLKDYDHAYGLKSVIFRYFNAAGADPHSRSGENHDPETHLIPLIFDVAVGKRENICVFGSDYDTPDGTCIRDYIHVTDLAAAHLLGMDYLCRTGESNVFNLGNQSGVSVNEVIDTARGVTGREIPCVYAARREGDPAKLVGCADKASQELGWKQQYSEVETILSHAWDWHLRLNR